MDFQSLALLTVAVGPVIAIITYFYTKDKHDREPFGVLLVSFLTGCFSVVPAIILEEILPSVVPGSNGPSIISVAIYTFIIVAGSEEFCKYIFLRYYAYKKPSFNEPYDGIIYAVMVGMGFATIENLMYIFGSETVSAAWTTAGLRAVTAVPAHATFAAIMGYYIGLAKFNHKNERKLMLQGFIGAVILHGLYDFFLFQNLTAALYIGALVSLIIGIRFTMRSVKLHKQHPNSFQHQTSTIAETDSFESPNKPQ